MNIAFVHDYLYTFGGAERLLMAMHSVFPDAPIITTQYVPDSLPMDFPHNKVISVGSHNSILAKYAAKQLNFLYPYWFENIDFSEYDIVVSSTTCFAKGILTNSTQKHICYCHTPPRFLYGYEGESTKREVWYYRPFVRVISSWLRVWDYAAAQRVDMFLANSINTSLRIKKFYGRDSTVLYPPVDTHVLVSQEIERNYFLVVSRLVTYKHVELAVNACSVLGLPLKVVGVGPQEQMLKRLAGNTVRFEGFVDNKRLSELYANCKALIYTAYDEDFGITPIEAMAHGRPVIAHRSGGMIETVKENSTGSFFDEYSVEGLISTLQSFDMDQYDPEHCKARAEDFSLDKFQSRFKSIVET